MYPAWVRQLLETVHDEPCVLVTLRQRKGSAPRESGARMVVTENELHGSIGGGNLEYQAIATAREMLSKFRHPGNAEGEIPRHPGNANGPTNRHPGNANSVVRDPLAGTESPTEEVGPGQRLRRFRDDDGESSRFRDDDGESSRFRDDDFEQPRLEPYGLGPALNQCCGGSVELLYELLAPPAPDWLTALAQAGEHGDPAVLAVAVTAATPRHHVALPVGRESALPEALRAPVRNLLDDAGHQTIEVVPADGSDWWLQRISAGKRRLLLFGAGHVGKAVVKALADLPFEVRWVDAREDAFPDEIPRNTTPVSSEDALAEVGCSPPGASFIVMTHSHDLDEDICHAILERGDFAFLGLIGSVSKRRRFVHRLAARGIAEAALERLVCPIGLPDIRGKEPATIALSLAAQLMSDPRQG